MCAGEKTCTAGEKGTVNDRCPNACGARTQTRTCSSACEWGPLTVTSSSCVDCNDCSEVVFCDSHEHVANRGTWCRRTSDKCNVAELDQDCAADIASPDVCNGKLVQPLYKDWL